MASASEAAFLSASVSCDGPSLKVSFLIDGLGFGGCEIRSADDRREPQSGDERKNRALCFMEGVYVRSGVASLATPFHHSHLGSAIGP